MCHQLLTVSYLVLLGAYLGLGSDVQYEGKNYVREGSPFAITCKRPPLRPPKWTKDGITLEEEDSNYEIEKESQKGNVVTMRITVGSAQLKHRGDYKCDTMSNRSHRIEVVPSAETDETWRLEATKHLRMNEPLELYCAEVDNNIVDVEWYKDGYSISEGGRIQTSGQRRRTLIVKNATEEDAGEYTCSALGSTRPYLMTEQQGHVIHVTYEARVEKFQHQIRPIFGRNFTLECKVHGYPVPRVTWFIDDEPAESFVQHHNRTSILDNAQGLPNSVFFIENVTYDDDDHKVTCHAENFEGSDETSVSLAVMENMISTNEVEPGKGIVLIPGSDLTLQCNVTDSPQMNVNWLKNGFPLNVTDERIEMTVHNTLTILRTTEGDAGSYVCEVNDENTKANATIVVRTEIKLLPFDHSRNIVEGQNIILTCNVTQGTPLPTLQWFKDGEPLNLTDPRISAEGDRGIDAVKITIKEAEFDDRAEYMCVAANDFGSVNGTILVRVKDKFAALWPFLGICAEVAILITIIFIYEKKRQKPDYDESEADHNTENKTVPDQEDKSQDVRQRK